MASWLRWLGRALSVVCLVAGMYYIGHGRWLRGGAWLAASLVPVAIALPRGRRLYFALAAIALSCLATVVFVAGLDLYLHHRFAKNGGYNIWGYRGAPVGRKQPGERRFVMLGGSVAFGYGVATDETIPFYVEQRLNQYPQWPPTSVVNLGWNGEGAYSFSFTLKDYEYLGYDTVILYSGYNDLGYNNLVFRHESTVFRLTGYLPILPIVPIRQWLHVEDLSDTRDGRVVFRPNLADRYAAEAADMALRVSQALERELGRLATPDPRAPVPPEPADSSQDLEHGCETEWVAYCDSMRRAVDLALHAQKQVFVVTEPYRDWRHFRQQRAAWSMLKQRYLDDPHLHYVDLGTSIDLNDRTLCYDGLHLTAAGNARIASRLAPVIRDTLAPVAGRAPAGETSEAR